MSHGRAERATKMAGAFTIVMVSAVLAAQTTGRHPAGAIPRLYIFDCGEIKNLNVGSFNFAPGELAHPHAAVPCHLIVHPQGTLVWDTGVVPDHLVGTGQPGTDRVTTTLRKQMEVVGYRPEDITYLALSHYHIDHAANANLFRLATWLVRRPERDAMFAATPPMNTNASHFNLLKNSKTVILENEEHDVFGDGTVVLKAAVGHTPGHQVLRLNLAKTGPVILAGDLYHFPEQRMVGRFPTFEFNVEQSRASRAQIEAYVNDTGAQLWIEHDYAANAKLRKAPQYYE